MTSMTMSKAETDKRDLPEFRALLRLYRDARRWSQERLAGEADLDHSLVSRLESGQRTPTPNSIGKLCQAFDLDGYRTDEFWLAGGLTPPGTPHATLARLMAVVRDNGEGAVRVALHLVAQVQGMKAE
jgi:transcriptional regulator with XRE-family HTH domain